MKRVRKTVCIADLSNFAVLVEHLGEEKGIKFLQEIYEFAGDIILKYGGTIHKYMGDAVLFSFPDPEQAVKAVHLLAEKQWEAGNLTTSFYIGVSTGHVYIGPVGHPSYLVEDLFGLTVNQAGLLLRTARNNSNHISLCENTRAAIKPD